MQRRGSGVAMPRLKIDAGAVSATSLLHLKPSTLTEHKIELINPIQEPIRQKMRRIPFSKREEFDKMIDEMLEAKLIQPSNSLDHRQFT